MRVRDKAGQNSQERIMEIVGLLLRKILASPNGAGSGRELARELERSGYGRAEIDAAFELVFAVPEILTNARVSAPGSAAVTVRVFSSAEQARLSRAVRDQMLRYRATGLLTENEWEDVLLQLLLADGRELGLDDLQQAIRKVVCDEERLILMNLRVTPHAHSAVN